MTPGKTSGNKPEIVEMPAQKMATVYARGAPVKVFPRVLPVLYNSVTFLNFDRKKSGIPVFKIGGLRARYPDAHLSPMEKWTNVIGLPVPEDTTYLPQEVGGTEVKLETWEYGTVAQIHYHGSYEQEGNSVERLLRFIIDNDYEIVGVHEEEYLNSPDAKAPRTIIRYRVKKK
jgi:effector-binding domain-containing protein